ncbi:UDP-glycosyltransferase 87A2-like [Magnolia sinica]|uniref:UDP-glycosyltransferase 87A2-like n=1 Tax=Magnolia sinica TaxID=86752 RepID=UPI00265B3B5C|nr:UDP-glycosyltransferase 87A2-like [Magnolia sinica]
MESIYAGVIMLTFPLVVEQFTNAKFIVEDWKVGVRVRREMGSESMVKGDEIAGIVQWAMNLDCDESREMRRRAEELQETCKKALEDVGSSNINLNAFVRDNLYGHD